MRLDSTPTGPHTREIISSRCYQLIVCAHVPGTRRSVRDPRGVALLEMQEHGAKLAGLDVEGLLEFALLVLRDASRLWSEAGVEQRQKTQCVFFPEGLAFDGE